MIAQSMLPEYDHEMATTRSLLALVPEAKATWQPHAKSMTMGKLAIHLATLPSWSKMTLQQTEFDIEPPGGSNTPPAVSTSTKDALATNTPPAVFTTTKDALATFDKEVKEGRAIIAAASDADMMVPWTFKKGGTAIFTIPRVAVLRTWVVNHTIHHRGQLSVYLRLNDVPLPSIYGPTADTA